MEGVGAARSRCCCQCPTNYRNNRGNNSVQHRADCRCKCSSCSAHKAGKSARKCNTSEYKSGKLGKTECYVPRGGGNCTFRPGDFAILINSLIGNVCNHLPGELKPPLNSQPKCRPQPQCQPQSRPEPLWQPQPRPEPLWQPQTQPEPQWQPEPEPEQQWKPEPERQWQPEAEWQPQPKTQWQPPSEQKWQPPSEQQWQPPSEQQWQPPSEQQWQSETEPEPEPQWHTPSKQWQLETEPEWQLEVEAEPEPRWQAEPEPLLEQQFQSEPEPEPEQPQKESMEKHDDTELNKRTKPLPKRNRKPLKLNGFTYPSNRGAASRRSLRLQALTTSDDDVDPEYNTSVKMPYEFSLPKKFNGETDKTQEPISSYAPELAGVGSQPREVSLPKQCHREPDKGRELTLPYAFELASVGSQPKAMNSYIQKPYDVSLPKNIQHESDKTQEPTSSYAPELAGVGLQPRAMNCCILKPYELSSPKNIHHESGRESTHSYAPELDGIGSQPKSVNSYIQKPYEVSLMKNDSHESDKTKVSTFSHAYELAGIGSLQKSMNSYIQNPYEVSLPKNNVQREGGKCTCSSHIDKSQASTFLYIPELASIGSPKSFHRESDFSQASAFVFSPEVELASYSSLAKPGTGFMVAADESKRYEPRETLDASYYPKTKDFLLQKRGSEDPNKLSYVWHNGKQTQKNSNRNQKPLCVAQHLLIFGEQIFTPSASKTNSPANSDCEIDESRVSDAKCDEQTGDYIKLLRAICCNKNKPKQQDCQCNDDIEEYKPMMITESKLLKTTSRNKNRKSKQCSWSDNDDNDCCKPTRQDMCSGKNLKVRRASPDKETDYSCDNDVDDKINACIKLLQTICREKNEKIKQSHFNDSNVDKSLNDSDKCCDCELTETESDCGCDCKEPDIIDKSPSTSFQKNGTAEQDCKDDAYIDTFVKILQATLIDKNKKLKQCCFNDKNMRSQNDDNDGKLCKCEEQNCACNGNNNASGREKTTQRFLSGQSFHKSSHIFSECDNEDSKSCKCKPILKKPDCARNCPGNAQQNDSLSTFTELACSEKTKQHCYSNNNICQSLCDQIKQYCCPDSNFDKSSDGGKTCKSKQSNCACNCNDAAQKDDSIKPLETGNKNKRLQQCCCDDTKTNKLCNACCHSGNNACDCKTQVTIQPNQRPIAGSDNNVSSRECCQNFRHNDKSCHCSKTMKCCCSGCGIDQTLSTSHQTFNVDGNSFKSKPIGTAPHYGCACKEDGSNNACIAPNTRKCCCASTCTNESYSTLSQSNDDSDSSKRKYIAQEPVCGCKCRDDAKGDTFAIVKTSQSNNDRQTSTLRIIGNDHDELLIAQEIACPCKCADDAKRDTGATLKTSQSTTDRRTRPILHIVNYCGETSKSELIAQELACPCKCTDDVKRTTYATLKESHSNTDERNSPLRTIVNDLGGSLRSVSIAPEPACPCKCADDAKRKTYATLKESHSNTDGRNNPLRTIVNDPGGSLRSVSIALEPVCPCKCADDAKRKTYGALKESHSNTDGQNSPLRTIVNDLGGSLRSVSIAPEPACPCKCADDAKRKTYAALKESQSNIDKRPSPLLQIVNYCGELSRGESIAQEPTNACKCSDDATKATHAALPKSESKSESITQEPDSAHKYFDDATKEACIKLLEAVCCQNNTDKTQGILRKMINDQGESSNSKSIAQEPGHNHKYYDDAKRDTRATLRKTQSNTDRRTNPLRSIVNDHDDSSRYDSNDQEPISACKCSDDIAKEACIKLLKALCGQKTTCAPLRKSQSNPDRRTSALRQTGNDHFEQSKSKLFAQVPFCFKDICEGNKKNGVTYETCCCENSDESCESFLSEGKGESDLRDFTEKTPNPKSKSRLYKIITNTTYQKTKRNRMDSMDGRQFCKPSQNTINPECCCLCKSIFDLKRKHSQLATSSSDSSGATEQGVDGKNRKRKRRSDPDFTEKKHIKKSNKPLRKIVNLTTETVSKKTKHKTPSSLGEVPRRIVSHAQDFGRFEKNRSKRRGSDIEDEDQKLEQISRQRSQRRTRHIQSYGDKQEKRKPQPQRSDDNVSKASSSLFSKRSSDLRHDECTKQIIAKCCNTAKLSPKNAARKPASREPAMKEYLKKEEKAPAKLAKDTKRNKNAQNCEFSLMLHLVPSENCDKQLQDLCCCPPTTSCLGNVSCQDNCYRQCAGREGAINRDCEEIGYEQNYDDSFQNVIAAHVKETASSLLCQTNGGQYQRQADASSSESCGSVAGCTKHDRSKCKGNKMKDKTLYKENSEESHELNNAILQYNNTNFDKSRKYYQPVCEIDADTTDEDDVKMARRTCSSQNLTPSTEKAFKCVQLQAGVAYNYTNAGTMLPPMSSWTYCNRANQVFIKKQCSVQPNSNSKNSIGIVINRSQSNSSFNKPVNIIYHRRVAVGPNASNSSSIIITKQQHQPVDSKRTKIDSETATKAATVNTTQPEPKSLPHSLIASHENRPTIDTPSKENAAAILQESTRTCGPIKPVHSRKMNADVSHKVSFVITTARPMPQYANEATQTNSCECAKASISQNEGMENLRPKLTKITTDKPRSRDTSRSYPSSKASPVAAKKFTTFGQNTLKRKQLPTTVQLPAARSHLRDSGKGLVSNEKTQKETAMSTVVSPTLKVGANEKPRTLLSAVRKVISDRSRSKECEDRTRPPNTDDSKPLPKAAQCANRTTGTMTAASTHAPDNFAKSKSTHLDCRGVIKLVAFPTIAMNSEPELDGSHRPTSCDKHKLDQSDSLIYTNLQSEKKCKHPCQHKSPHDSDVCCHFRQTTMPHRPFWLESQLPKCTKSPSPVNDSRKQRCAHVNSTSASLMPEERQRHERNIHFDADVASAYDDAKERDRSSSRQLSETDVSEISIDSPPRYVPLNSKRLHTTPKLRFSGGAATPSTLFTQNRALADSEKTSKYAYLCSRLSHRMYVPRRRDNLVTMVRYPSPMWNEQRYIGSPSRATSRNYSHER